MQNTTIPKHCVVLDTETTGFSYKEGDRMVEIGAVVMADGLPTARRFHKYINPQRIVPDEVVKIHGLTTERLADEPVFDEIADELVQFLGDLPIVAHNALFDAGFINYEIGLCGYAPYPNDRFVDTVAIARRKFPGRQTNLNALCRRFEISLTGREFHGAMLDALLLAEVCVELSGGRQGGLFSPGEKTHEIRSELSFDGTLTSLPSVPTPSELASHAGLIAKLGDTPVWTAIARTIEEAAE